MYGTLYGLLVKSFLIQHHIRLDNSTASAPGYTGSLCHRLHTVGSAAAHTVITQHGAVELIYRAAARCLVQAVNILGHHSGALACLLQLCQFVMGSVGLGKRTQHFAAIKAVEFRWVLVKKAARKDLLRRIVVLLMIQAVHTAKVRNTALGRHPGAAKKDDAPRTIYNFL